MVTSTVVVAPAASDPPAAESVTQPSSFDAVQLIDWPPVFESVYVWLVGENGPPWLPDEVSPPAGVTDKTPAEGGELTVKDTPRVVLPFPFEVLVKVTVSE